MSKYDQIQCAASLERLIDSFEQLERAVSKNDWRWTGLCIRAIRNHAANARISLELWHKPEDEETRRERELEERLADYEPEVYDRFGKKIFY